MVGDGDVKALSQRMRQLMQDEHLRETMGRRAVQRALDFDMEKIGLQWTDLFEQLIKQYGRNLHVVR